MVSVNVSFNVTPANELSVLSSQTLEKESKVFKASETFVSNEAVEVCEIVIDLVLSFVIANVGIVSNVIVIVVFAKQGFKESMSVSMSAIAVWDLIKCLAGSLQRMVGPISLVSLADADSWRNINASIMNYVVSFATYVSSVLAAYIAVERCLCVCLPFVVKSLLTPKVAFIAMTSLSVIVFGAFAVMFAIYDIYWVYTPKWNTTTAKYRHSAFYHMHEVPLMKYYNISGVFWPMASFVVIVICTTIIVVQLRKASDFRSKSKAIEGNSTISDRDKKVVKMLLVIIAIYVINLSPRIAVYLAKDLVYELYFLRKYHNLFVVIAYICFFFDFVNATVNLYVFLLMSTNFKATAKELFNCGGEKKTPSNNSVSQIKQS